MKIAAVLATVFIVVAPALAVQVVVGGTQSVEGFPFYGC